MADFNISANYNVNPTSRNYRTAPTSISFQAAQACRVTFAPATGNCFGVSYLDLAGGNDTTSLNVVASVETDGTAAAQPQAMAAAVGKGAAEVAVGDPDPDTFQITFGTDK